MTQANDKEITAGTTITAGTVIFGEGRPCLIIAEIGNNHNGSLALAKRLVDEAVAAGADAVKFQIRDLDSLYGDTHKGGRAQADLGAQYTLDLLSRFQLSKGEMREILSYAKKKNVLSFCTPWDIPSVAFLESCNVDLYKIASADLTNHPLLECVAATGKPLICSTGMATDEEITQAANLLHAKECKFALLHCNSTYPAPFKDINLLYMLKLKKFQSIVGYSGHERGIHIPVAAVALGAQLIEKHFTLDKNMEGVDHRVSLLPDEFKQMVQQIRELESALGNQEGPRKISQGELMNRENLGKSIVAHRAISKGEVFTESMLTVVSPGTGLPPYMLQKLLGEKAKRNLEKGEVLFPSDLPESTIVKPGTYSFSRPWGIPVRHHDARKFLAIAKPDFIEFHLSYGDMEEDPSKFLDEVYSNTGFTVHAPELFAGDHILDLCSSDPKYLKLSMANMQRVIDITRALKPRFPKTKRPMIVATVGGFTKHEPLSAAQRKELYPRILDSLNALDSAGVEVLPQSAAPFPWHMGGQQYQNLFLYPDEIAAFCSSSGYRICLDVSHSYLACNHFKINPKEFFETVAPYTAEIHIGDSAGVDGEGLQIGKGEVDFAMLGQIFKKHCPDAWFIPEIWQGHKNMGEGFWIALEKLNRIL